MNFVEELNWVVVATICVTLWGHSLLLVGFTAYFISIHDVSFKAIDTFCSNLRFPINVIFKLYTQGNPQPFLRLAAAKGASCEILIFIIMGSLSLFPFGAFSFFRVISGVYAGNPARVIINLLLLLWVIFGVAYAYYFARKLKE